jgi:hypothetical protein
MGSGDFIPHNKGVAKTASCCNNGMIYCTDI